jgi:hypothetical protein
MAKSNASAVLVNSGSLAARRIIWGKYVDNSIAAII